MFTFLRNLLEYIRLINTDVGDTAIRTVGLSEKKQE